MIGKLANFSPDTKKLSGEDMTALKILSGDTPITIEEKYKNSKEIALNIKLFNPLNRIGEIADDTDGTFRRLGISNFPQKYKDELTKEELEDPVQEYKLADTELIGLFAEEAQGIFNELMDRLDKLEERKFKFGNSANQNRARYNVLRNKLPVFVKTHIRFNHQYNYKNWFEYTDFIYAQLHKFCKKHNVPTPSKDALSKYLVIEIETRFKTPDNKDNFEYRGKRTTPEGVRKWGYYGITYLSDEDIELNSKREEEMLSTASEMETEDTT